MKKCQAKDSVEVREKKVRLEADGQDFVEQNGEHMDAGENSMRKLNMVNGVPSDSCAKVLTHSSSESGYT
jgi:hypothetical protein